MTNYSAVPSLAKRALYMAAQETLVSIERSAGVADQMNASHLADVIDEINALTRVEAYRLAKAIDAAEEYDPAADKWGFGPRKIYPGDFLGFMPTPASQLSEIGRLI